MVLTVLSQRGNSNEHQQDMFLCIFLSKLLPYICSRHISNMQESLEIMVSDITWFKEDPKMLLLYNVQKNLNDSNTDNSFTFANSNSFLSS